MTPQSCFLSVRGVTLHDLEWGAAGFPPLVLIHGGSAHAHWWDHIAVELAHTHHVIALDSRGHGDSDRAIPPAYEMNDLGVRKPAGVFFGEPIPVDAMYRSQEAAQTCDVVLVIGTSAVVSPAADIPRVAKQAGARVIEINPEKTDLTSWVSDFIILEKAGVAIPQIIAAIKAMAS
jgi:NAD-dependent SIR2 family protein deacetylase